ncbi:MAG: 2-C-methyl-D-erythritol 4-phosphate cytidylyltransferase, partial [Bacteroidales bacterium]|nr:2-C-methyl-D-erythritol 4-phosphate cytidylyltransferase [Bacteroidales bacterium]
MDKYVVILACGKGSRMGTEIPKQYLLLDNKPVIFHTIERISQFDKNYKIIVVINKEHADLFSDLSKKYALSVPFLLVFGGDERYFSVKNALDVITNINSLVAIHDGVRPFADKEMFSRCFNEAERYGNAVCAMKATDSIRKGTENLNTALKRDEIFFVQTPQTFRTENIKKAYLQ